MDKPTSLLEEAIRLVDGDRAKVYGDPAPHYTAAELAFGSLEPVAHPALGPAETHMVRLAVTKLARWMSNPWHRDSLVDCAGYLELVDRTWRGSEPDTPDDKEPEHRSNVEELDREALIEQSIMLDAELCGHVHPEHLG